MLDSLRYSVEARAEPVIVTVDGVDCGSDTAATKSVAFWHATCDTVNTAGLSVPMVTPSPP